MSKLDKERTELVKQRCRITALDLVFSLDKDSQTAHSANALAVASVKVLIVLDFCKHPCVSFKDFLCLDSLTIA